MKIGFLLIVHFERAAGVEEHGVEIVQVFGVVLELLFGERFGVGADGGVPQSGFTAQSFNGCQRVRDRFMAVAFFFADGEQVLLGRGCVGA